jgi:hypothetical protein
VCYLLHLLHRAVHLPSVLVLTHPAYNACASRARNNRWVQVRVRGQVRGEPCRYRSVAFRGSPSDRSTEDGALEESAGGALRLVLHFSRIPQHSRHRHSVKEVSRLSSNHPPPVRIDPAAGWPYAASASSFSGPRGERAMQSRCETARYPRCGYWRCTLPSPPYRLPTTCFWLGRTGLYERGGRTSSPRAPHAPSARAALARRTVHALSVHPA